MNKVIINELGLMSKKIRMGIIKYIKTLDYKNKKIKKLLLVNPPDVDENIFSIDIFKRGRYTNYPPYGLAILSSNIRELGVNPSILNLNNEVLKNASQNVNNEFDFQTAWVSVLKSTIEDINPDLVLVTCMFSQTHKIFCKVVNYINTNYPNLMVLVGGVHVSNSLEVDETRNKIIEDLPNVHFFFYGEGDLSIKYFIDFLNGNKNINDIGQFWYRENSMAYKVETNYRPNSNDLNILPSHDLICPIEHSKYGKIGAYFYLKNKEAVFANVLANRGCRAQCTFCSVRNFNGLGVRRRTAESVIQELQVLKDIGVDHIMWLDDDFLYNESSSIELFNEMVKKNLNLTWDCTNGVIAASCTHEIIDAAALSGCIGLSIGMESGNKDILRGIKKPGTVKNFINAAENLRKFPQIYTRVFLIIGFPNETYSQMLDTLTVSKEMNLDWHQIQVLQPLPNTPIYTKMVQEGLIDPKDFAEVRYIGGVYGKNSEKNSQLKDVLAFKSIDALEVSDKSAIVPASELQSIWSKFVVELNYKRPNLAKLPELKLQQLLMNYEYVSDYVAPHDMFALRMRIECMKILGKKDDSLINRLSIGLENTPEWVDRFQENGISMP